MHVPRDNRECYYLAEGFIIFERDISGKESLVFIYMDFVACLIPVIEIHHADKLLTLFVSS